VENLGRALAEGGLMMIGNTESFVVLRKRGGQLLSLLREDVGALAISP
jgi:hypothetical protein